MKAKLTLALGALLILSSCGKIKQAQEDKKAKAQAVVDATATIKFTNSIIDESNNIYKWADGGERSLQKLSAIAANPSLMKQMENIGFFMSDMFSQYDIPQFYANTKGPDLTEAPASMTEEDKMFFKTQATTYLHAKTSLRSLYNNIKTYIKEENYKDDKGALGKMYSDSVQVYYLTMMGTIGLLSERASALGEEAEMLTMEDSPMKSSVVAMREQMKLAHALIIAFDGITSGETKAEDVAKLYESYLSASDKNLNQLESLQSDLPIQKDAIAKFIKTNQELNSKLKVQARNAQNGEKIKTEVCTVYYQSLVSDYNYTVSR